MLAKPGNWTFRSPDTSPTHWIFRLWSGRCAHEQGAFCRRSVVLGRAFLIAAYHVFVVFSTSIRATSQDNCVICSRLKRLYETNSHVRFFAVVSRLICLTLVPDVLQHLSDNIKVSSYSATFPLLDKLRQQFCAICDVLLQRHVMPCH